MPKKRVRNLNPNPERPMINIKLEDTHDDEAYGLQPGTAPISNVVHRQRRKDNELSQLMDSLTGYYTPVTGRRSSKPVIIYDGGTIGSSSDEDDKIRVRKKIEAMNKKTQQPLSVDVNLTMDASAETSDSQQSSKIQKNLTDSLSPYFSAMKEKRRTVKRGEFLSLSGVRQKAATTDHNSEGGATTDSTVSPVVVMPERRKNTAGIGPVVGRRRTQNSASAALFSSPEKEINEDDDSFQQRVKRPRTPKQLFSPKAERKMMQLQPTTSQNNELSPISSDGEYYQQLKEKKKIRKKKSEKLGSRKDGTLISGGIDDKENIVDDGSITISSEQREMFEKIRRKVAAEIDLGESTSGQYQEKVDKEPRLPRAIRIGRYQIDTWYSSPFPMEYIHVPILYMCDFCLKYVKTENMMVNHLRKCKLYHPPGTEIYRKDNVSVFEVDGNCAKSYCQNLCLLSKSFLDHKTLFYDVEPFLFYIVTKNDSEGCHFVGYFSKEKYSQQKFNLSCIVTLPSYQKQGFGRFLIDFSFLLSRTEKMPGTPEKPLSDLGRISYASYWRTALFEWIYKMDLAKDSQFSIEDICDATGIAKFDIVEVFDTLGWFKVEDDNIGLFIDYELVNSHWEKVKKDKSRIWLDEKCLKWTPRNFSPSKDNFRSPLRSPITPMKTPTSATTKTSTPSGVSLAAVGSTIKSGVSTSRRAPVGRNLKQKFEEEKREILEDSTNSESESSDEEDEKFRNRRKTWCKESINRKTRKRDDSPEDDTPKRGRKDTGTSSKKGEEKRRNTLNGNSGNINGDSRSKKNQRGGKMIFEDSSDKSNSSSTSSVESSDEDAVYTTGKPQKGKTSRPQKNQRKKHVPPQKGGNRTQNQKPIHNPGKVFPNNCAKQSACESTKIKNDPIIEGASETNIGEKLEKTENEQEAEEVAGAAVTVNDTGPSHQGNYEEDEKDSTFIVHPSTTTTTTDDSDNSGGESDEEKKRDCQIDTRFDRMTPLSTTTDNSAISSRAETPRPIGDQPIGDDMINMGFEPDDDDQTSRFGAPEENDGPPALDLCPAAPLPIGDDDNPPMLNIVPENQQRNSLSLDVSHSIQEPDGYSTEDEAPPQLSPNFGKTEQDELSEKEKMLEAMDRPPMAPVAAGIEIDEDEKLYQQHSANAQVGIGSVGAPGSNQMMMQPPMSNNMMTPTSQHPYSQGPGSMQQATPGSGGVPSCNPMYNQSTPEQQSQQNQQTFMSPSMQGMPSSVSSVHSVHNSSMEMPGPSQPSQVQQVPQQQQQQYVQQNDMMQNGPSTSMAQFGSPQNVQQPVSQPVVTQHQQQQVQQIQQHRNSGGRESSSSRKQRQAQQQAQQQAQHQQQLQQQQHMQQMQQHMNMQFHGYPPGYSNYPYPPFDAFNYQYWPGQMFPQYYTQPGRMPTTTAATANQAWPAYQNGAVAAQGSNANPTGAVAAAGVPPHQFPPNPAAGPFPGFPPDLYSNFYMKNG